MTCCRICGERASRPVGWFLARSWSPGETPGDCGRDAHSPRATWAALGLSPSIAAPAQCLDSERVKKFSAVPKTVIHSHPPSVILSRGDGEGSRDAGTSGMPARASVDRCRARLRWSDTVLAFGDPSPSMRLRMTRDLGAPISSQPLLMTSTMSFPRGGRRNTPRTAEARPINAAGRAGLRMTVLRAAHQDDNGGVRMCMTCGGQAPRLSKRGARMHATGEGARRSTLDGSATDAAIHTGSGTLSTGGNLITPPGTLVQRLVPFCLIAFWTSGVYIQQRERPEPFGMSSI